MLMHCAWECKMVQPRWRTTWEFLRKLKGVLCGFPVKQLVTNSTKSTDRCNMVYDLEMLRRRHRQIMHTVKCNGAVT